MELATTNLTLGAYHLELAAIVIVHLELQVCEGFLLDYCSILQQSYISARGPGLSPLLFSRAIVPLRCHGVQRSVLGL